MPKENLGNIKYAPHYPNLLTLHISKEIGLFLTAAIIYR